jgi:mono/diheme cytochrome c family protein
MAVLAFVLLFVLLALVAFFLAMSGGPKAARRKAQGRKGVGPQTVLFLIVLLVLGIGIPLYAFNTERDRRSIPEASVTELTALQEKGRELFGQRCRNCHTLKAANATAKVGPTLNEPPRPKALVLDAIEKGRSSGNGQMPAEIYEGEEAEAVAEFVAVASGGEVEDAPAENSGEAEAPATE